MEHFLIVFSLLLSTIHFSSLAFSPTTSHFLNCGSSSTITLPDNRPFQPDTNYFTSSSTNSPSLTSSSSSFSSSIYDTARAFTSSATYDFKVATSATYIVRLHFSPFPTQSHNLSDALFNVSALDKLLLADFSPTSTTVIKEFLLWANADPLTLNFDTSKLAFVNAIEVFNAPPNLIDTASLTNVTVSGPGSPVSQLPQQGLETLYRVNVGGHLVTPENDTLWRTWVPDDDKYFISDNLSFKNGTDTDTVKYGIDNPDRTPEIAPQSVYATSRTMAVTQNLIDSNPLFNFNLTWSFPVRPREILFIRMHFCNNLFPVATLYFDVCVGPFSAYSDLQPGEKTAMTPAAAFYMDFAVVSDDSKLINVSLGRSSKSQPSNANALLNGLEIMKLGLTPLPYNNSKDKIKRKPTKIVVSSVVGGVVLIIVLIAVVFFFIVRRRRRQRSERAAKPKASSSSPYMPYALSNSTKSSDRNTGSTSPRVNLHLLISLEEVLYATDDFSEKLIIGSGGFGKVYKGVLRDGTKVAIKRGMRGSRQGYPEFQTEIEILSKIRHRHLVSLVGYCEDRSEMILVYEYMEKGPLKNYLYGSPDLPCLSWKQRLEICIGAARGLHYLHTGYSHNIIHRDIKSTNILLGEGYLAKVADFGLSRIGPSFGETHVSTAVKGTFGYLDPEYFKGLKLTDKSDVYSFGVMLLEILCARPVIDQEQAGEQLNLMEWALICYREGQLEKVVDPRLLGQINANSLRKFVETAEKCLADYGIDRPSIGDVLWNLEYALQLQQTQLKREAFEDSGAVETQLPVNTVRRLPSNVALDVDDDEDDDVEEEVAESVTRTDEHQSSTTTSTTVFSQLITKDGR